MKPPVAGQQERASALLTALFITVIVALLATSVAYKFRLITHLAALDTASSQLTLYASGVTKQAEISIAAYGNAWQATTPSGRFLTIPLPIMTTTPEGITVHANSVDATSLFNINNLAYPNTQQGFMNLLTDVVPTLSPDQALQLTNNITDWLLPRTNDNADQLYAHYNPPYRAAHQAMVTISELRQVAGVTPAIFNALRPYVTALPTAVSGSSATTSGQATTININTATVPVLLTLSPKMTITQAEALYNCRLQHGIFLNTQQVLSTCVNQNSSVSMSGFAVSSNYFLVYSTAAHNDQRINMITLVSTHQGSNSKSLHSYIIWQILNGS